MHHLRTFWVILLILMSSLLVLSPINASNGLLNIHDSHNNTHIRQKSTRDFSYIYASAKSTEREIIRAYGKITTKIIEMSSNAYLYEAEIIIDNYKIKEYENGKMIYINGFSMLSNPGCPVVPFKMLIFELPPGAIVRSISVRFISKEILNINPNELVSAGFVYTTNCCVNKTTWNEYPPKNYEVVFDGYFREKRLLQLCMYPVKCIFDEHKVILYKKIKITISFEIKEAKYVEPLGFTDEILRKYDVIKVYAGDYEQLPDYSEHLLLDLLIIAPKKFTEEINRLISWKEKNGIRVYFKSVEDISREFNGRDLPEKIRNFIKYMYYHYQIKWVLLVGDNDTIPPRYVFAKDPYAGDGDFVPTDYYYAGLDGTWDSDGDGIFGESSGDIDWYPEVFVGRIPVKTVDELHEVINRIIEYENNTKIIADYKWAILAGAYSNYDADIDGDDLKDWDKTDEAKLNYYIMERFLIPNGFNYTRLYETEGLDPTDYEYDFPLSAENMLAALANGSMLVNIAAHGYYDSVWRKIWIEDRDSDGLADEYTSSDGDEHEWRPFLTTSMQIRTKAPYYPLFYIDACLTGGFDWNADCLAEYLIKTIAIGVVASTRVSWYKIAWDPGTDGGYYNQGLAYRFWEFLINKSYNRPVEALYLSKLDYINDKGFDSDNCTLKNLLEYIYFGDPSIIIPINFVKEKVLFFTASGHWTYSNEYRVLMSGEYTYKNGVTITNSTWILEDGTKLKVIGDFYLINSRLLAFDGQKEVRVRNGVFTIKRSSLKAIKIIAVNATIIINDSLLFDRSEIIINNCSKVIIYNSEINNDFGIIINNTKSVSITNNVFENNMYALRLSNIEELVITHNTFAYSEKCGVDINNCGDLYIKYNYFYHDQLWIRGSKESILNATVEDNFRNNKPIIFLATKTNAYVKLQDMGQIICAYCENIFLSGGYDTVVFIYGSQNVMIRDIKLHDESNGIIIWNTRNASIIFSEFYDNLAAILIKNSAQVQLENLYLRFNTYGIVINDSYQIKIAGCEIEKNNVCVKITNSLDVRLEENEFCAENTSLEITYTSTVTGEILIKNNLFESSSLHTVGINITSNVAQRIQILIENNTIRNMSYGILISIAYAMNDCVLSKNSICHADYGIYINNTHGNVEINDNTLCKSETAIYVHNSSDIIITRNIIMQNTRGVYLNSAKDIIIYENCFLFNALQAYDDQANHWNYSKIGNYWSDYLGIDINGDDILDAPYVIDENSIDFYPLMYYKSFPDLNSPVLKVYSNITNNTITNADSILIQWNVTDEFFRFLGIYINGTLIQGSVSASGMVIISFKNYEEYNVTRGYNITIIAQDIRKNTAHVQILFTHDAKPPHLEILHPMNDSVFYVNSVPTIVTLYLSIYDDIGLDHIEIVINGTLTIKKLPCEIIPIELNAGIYILRIRIFDKAGNSQEKILRFLIKLDKIPPTLDILSPQNNSVVESESAPVLITVKLKVDDNLEIDHIEICIDGHCFKIAKSEIITIPLDFGEHTIVIKAVDIAGNIATKTLKISVRKSIPVSNMLLWITVIAIIILQTYSVASLKKLRKTKLK